jgi:outer membrane protein OmpA-like peptidoglycan-associated protein
VNDMFERNWFEFDALPFAGEFREGADMQETDFGQPELEWESEYRRRWSPSRSGGVFRAPRMIFPGPSKPAPRLWRAPAKFRWPRRVVMRRYGVGLAPDLIDAVPNSVTPETSSEYVRWAQSALNDVLRLQLPLNGVMDAATRSAVRSFQQREGLPADGAIGPDTERALIAARKTARGGEASSPPVTARNGAPPDSRSSAQQTKADATESEFWAPARPCNCASCRQGKPCACLPKGEGAMPDWRNQPDFEFESNVSFGESEEETQSELGDETSFSEFEDEAPLSEFEQAFPLTEFEEKSPVGEYESDLREFDTLEFDVPMGRKAPTKPTPTAPPLQCPPKAVPAKCPPAGSRPNAILDYFDFDKVAVKPGCHQILINDIARRIVQSQTTKQPICSLLLVGHTDRAGPDAYNLDLGHRRAVSTASAICNRLKTLKVKLACPLEFRLTTCGEQQPKETAELSRRVEVFLPAPPAPKGCPPFKERIRIHVKILVDPKRFTIERMLADMRRVYEPAGFLIELVSCERLRLPNLDVLDVHCPGAPAQLCCPFPCATNNLNAEHVALFGNRHNVGASDVVAYFVDSTLPGLNGCCAHPPGRPGVVVASNASQWTLAHETAHVLGLPHVAGEPCGNPAFRPTRLMTRCGTNRLAGLPTLLAGEITTMLGSALTLPC